MRKQHYSPQHIRIQNTNTKKLRIAGSMGRIPIATASQNETVEIGEYIYLKGKMIGSGYSSKVYKGYHKKTKQEYAIKVIDTRRYGTSSLSMLQNEIKILKECDHKNIIKCHQIYKIQKFCYIITEYCKQGDLSMFLTRRGKLDQKKAIEIIVQIVSALKYLFNKGIIHRDLKPANIMLHNGCWKIGDFGFALYCQNQVKTKHNVGTPLYMPLEALLNNIYSPQSDIFSVGILLYELLTSITPWQCKSEKDLIKKMGSQPFSLPQNCSIRQSTKSILQSFCAPDKCRRMSKQIFMKCNILQIYQNIQSIPEQAEVKLKKQKSIICLIKPQKSDQTQQTIPEQKNEAIFQKNNHILINQLHFCRFIYYIIKNQQTILIERRNKQKLLIVLFKHILTIIGHLGDSKVNWFRLEKWQLFKSSKKYLMTLITLEEYLLRYNKEYKNFIKNINPNLINQVELEFMKLDPNKEISEMSYHILGKFLRVLIKDFNNALTLQVLNQKNQDTIQIRGRIKGIKSLFKCYQLIMLSANYYLNYSYFQKHSQIKVHINFSTATDSSIDDFLKFRKTLKTLQF